MGGVYKYLVVNRGIQDAATYPFNEKDNKCKYNSTFSVARVIGQGNVTGEGSLMRALLDHGPLAIALNGEVDGFYFYGGGVFDDECPSRFWCFLFLC